MFFNLKYKKLAAVFALAAFAGLSNCGGTGQLRADGNTGEEDGIFEIDSQLMKIAPCAKNESYIVLAGFDAKDDYDKAAQKLAEFRKGKIIRFDPKHPEKVKDDLIRAKTRWVSVMVKPADMDINLLHQLITLSSEMDKDPFCDFAFGFITGDSAEGAGKFVDNIIKADGMALPKNSFNMSTTGAKESSISDGYMTPSESKEGYKGKSIANAVVENDKNVLEFMRKNIKNLEGGGLISFGGCGDPEGIWLFNDARNADDSKHWDYAPEKVGQDPNGEMPRVMAKDLKGLNLFPSVAWSGVCHMGAIQTVYVEPDITSTFGRVKKVTKHEIKLENSLTLALLNDGVISFFCSMGANHGFRSLIEKTHALSSGDRMGDVIRSGYHDLVMSVDGGKLIHCGVNKDGDAFERDALVYLWGKPQSRLLYGDPYYKPFPASKAPWLESEWTRAKDGKSLTLKLTAKHSSYYMSTVINSWDKNFRSRLHASVEIPDGVESLKVLSLNARNAGGKTVDVKKVICLLEQIDGKNILHLQASGPENIFAKDGTTLIYEIEITGDAQTKKSGGSELETGRVLDQKSDDKNQHTYLCYLPKAYDKSKTWPVLICFSNTGDAKSFTDIYSGACEKNGWILIASKEFNNERLNEIQSIANILWEDAKRRFSVDEKQLYLSGFSGGSLAAFCVTTSFEDNLAGIISIGGGNLGTYNKPLASVPVWLMCGDKDPLKPKMEGIKTELAKTIKHLEYKNFPGNHELPGASLGTEAVDWMQKFRENK